VKCRLLHLHREVNPGKLERLEALHREYVAYVRLCVETLLEKRRYLLRRSEQREFFPKSEKLTSQIAKNAQAHAVDFVSTWAKGVYARKMKPTITNLKREGVLSEEEAKALYVVGLKLIDKPWEFITQEHIDAYHALLDEYGGKTPQVRNSIPMRLTEMTSRLEDPKEATHADHWLRVSSLEARKSIWLPLVGNPYLKNASQASKGIQARKTKRGRWRFEVVQKDSWTIPLLPSDAPRIGIDVGLNVLATDSEGTLYGEHVKPKFDKLYARVKRLRANRQRQGLKENSPRLDCLESKLSGLIKTETGRVVNQLSERHPDKVFVVEDLDLRGCRGQKRFAYRALQVNLTRKAVVEVINPAYTSQECPSCGYISRRNRSGTRFVCKSCGRKSHADWVGASGVLRRSGDQDITCKDHHRKVKRLLRERYRLRRDSSSGVVQRRKPPYAPSPLGRKLTTRVRPSGRTGTASNSMPSFT